MQAQQAIDAAVAQAANAGLAERIAAAELAVQRGVGNIQRNIAAAQNQFRGNWFGGAEADIDRLTDALQGRLQAFGIYIQGLVAQWRAAIRAGVRDAGQLANAVPALIGGMSKAITGHDTALAGSEKAFSLLNNRRGSEDYYQQALLAEAKKENGFMDRLVRLMGQAPAIRRANF